MPNLVAARCARVISALVHWLALWSAFMVNWNCGVCGCRASEVADQVEFFERRIRPVLLNHCYPCHSTQAGKAEGELLLDSREGLLRGGVSGPVLEARQPEASRLLAALRHEQLEMPPDGKLPDEVVRDFEQWIRRGAIDPRDRPDSTKELPLPEHVTLQTPDEVWQAELAERSQWWNWQSPSLNTPPPVDDRAWTREPVDAYIRASHAKLGLTPAPTADPLVLLRRLSFVLTGLPPQPERMQRFVGQWQQSPQVALEQAVDELLAAPQFGERFARHWMDVVHYTDTYGYEWDIPAKGAWEYRDYLTRAFNEDVGFDQLIREHLAGDLLVEPRLNRGLGLNESLIGPMFFHLGERRHGSSLDFNGIHQEMVDSQIDVFSKAFLGVTVACARCHDHKLDAVAQADYYALAGMFMSPRWTSRCIDAADKYAVQMHELASLREAIRIEMSRLWSAEVAEGRLRCDVLQNWVEQHQAELDGTLLKPLRVAFTTADTAELTRQWQELIDHLSSARAAAVQRNASSRVLTDFSTSGFPAGWTLEGVGLQQGYVRDGTPLIALEGSLAISQLLERGYHTHALSSKLPGALRVPVPAQPGQTKTWINIAGGEWAGRQVAPQNAFLNEGPLFLDPAKSAQWLSIEPAGPARNGVSRVFTEFATAALHPNFPPRTGVARMGKQVLAHEDDGYDKRSWFSVLGIVADEQQSAPAETLEEFLTLYQGELPDSREAIQLRIVQWLSQAVNSVCQGRPTRGEVRVLNALLTAGLLSNDIGDSAALRELTERYREVEGTIQFPRSVNSMDERNLVSIDYRLNVRGDVHQEGPAVTRDFLQVVAGRHTVRESSGSGRLELARYLSSSANPLTARVYVNRVWQWIFGTGLVDTPNDFGKLGGRPVHPELLDGLAIEFMRDGWSTKRLVRQLVLSATFRQSGDSTTAGRELDPDNRWLHHYPTRRLEAEAIRDSLLSASGQLDAALFGRPIRPFRSAIDPQKRLFSGPLDGHGRRSLYLEMSIMQPPEFLVGFNLPDLKLSSGKRDVTNVPAQALTLLNDEFVGLLANRWADRLLADKKLDATARIQLMFWTALGRPATDEERARWLAAVRGFSGDTDMLSNHRAWQQLAWTLFNTKEFIYYR